MDGTGRFRLLYLLYFAGIGISQPFLSPYLRGLGFTEPQVGLVLAVGAVGAAPALLVWGVVSDRLGAPTRTLPFAAAGALLAVGALPWARTPLSVGLMLLGQGLTLPAVNSLLDAATIESIRAHPGISYARIRIFGSIGFVLAAQALGLLLWRRGDAAGDVAVPLAYVACVLGCAAVAPTLPRLAGHRELPSLRDAVALLRDRRLVVLLAASGAHQVAIAVHSQLFGVLVRDLHYPAFVTGTGSTVGVISEIGVLMLFPRLQRRFSSTTMLVAAFLGSSLRWVLLAESRSPLELIAVQALHGLTFALFWASLITLLGRWVPPHLRASGLALQAALSMSLATATGSIFAGLGYAHLGGAPAVYACAAAVELIPAGLALLLHRREDA